MSNDRELEKKLWKALRSDRTVMLGLAGPDARTRPMTALLDGDDNPYRGPLWIFTARDNALAEAVAGGPLPAVASFADKGHSLFAVIHGTLSADHDRTVVDRLWNPFIAAWYDGKDDPALALLRLDPDSAEIWADANSLIAGLKMLLGIDPRSDYQDKVAEVPLGTG